MPQRISCPCIQGYEIRCRISCENQISRRTQYAVVAARAFPLVAPANLTGLVINRLHHALGKSATIVSAPAFWFLVIIEDVVHAEGARGVDIEKTGIRAEARRMPVRR